MRKRSLLPIILALIPNPAGAAQIKLDLDVAITSKMINAIDQSSYPVISDPQFTPLSMKVEILFTNNVLSAEAHHEGGSVTFGPDLMLNSPLTGSLRYVPSILSAYPTVQSFDYTAEYGAWDKGSFIDFGQAGSEYPSAGQLLNYNWALISPTMDPRYPPLLDPLSYGSADLMSFLRLLRDDQAQLSYTEISYEMLNLTSPQSFYGTYYPYEEWYSGQATIRSISVDGVTDTPEACTFVMVATGSALWTRLRSRHQKKPKI